MPFRKCAYAHLLVARSWGIPGEGCVADHLVKTFFPSYSSGRCLMWGAPQNKPEAQLGNYSSRPLAAVFSILFPL